MQAHGSTYLGRDYGSYLHQHQEYLERCGLVEPDPIAGGYEDDNQADLQGERHEHPVGGQR